MRPLFLYTALGLGLAALAGPTNARGAELSGGEARTGLTPTPTPAPVPPPAKTEDGCGRFGTAIDFVSSPSKAAHQAARQQKLVFVLHVSGIFEDPNLT